MLPREASRIKFLRFIYGNGYQVNESIYKL
jgi:hypothetical protein